MNGFSYTETSDNKPYGLIVHYYPYAPWYSEATWNGLMHGVEVDNSDTGLTAGAIEKVHNQSLQKSLQTLKGAKVNLGVAFGERKQTSNLILGTAGRISNGLRDLRKGNLRGVAMHLGMVEDDVQSSVRKAQKRHGKKLSPYKALGNEWLALQYGWKPLLSDVYNAAEGLAALSGERQVRVSASESARWFNRHRNHLWQNVPALRTEQGIYSRKYVYVFSHSSEVLKDLSAFGITNPASVAWELLPWSFVFDWFVPLGDYIDVWDATLGLTFLKGSVTTFKKYRVQYDANGTVQPVPNSTYYTAYGHSRYTKVECTRGVLANFPGPNLPTFAPHITANRGVSTAALLRQRLKL